MKNTTKDLIAFGVTLGVFAVGSFLFVAIPDPYVRFHMPSDTFAYRMEHENTRLFAPGFAKYADYQAVLLGASHSMNFDPMQIDEVFGTTTWKLPLQGGSLHENRLLLDIAYKNQKQIDYVFCNIELERQYNSVTWDYISPFNMPYAYDFDFFSQVAYVYDWDMIRDRVIPMWKGLLSGEAGYVPSKSEFGYSQQSFTMGPTEVLKGFSGADREVISTFDNALTESEEANVRDIIRRNYSELIEAHPETQFYFFIPPYSMPWWGNAIIDGDVNYLHQVERVYIEELSCYDNVKCFDFNDCYEIMADLNNYGDITHFGEWVNDTIIEDMYRGKHEITLENCDAIMADESEHFKNFDYDSLYEQEDLPDPIPRYNGQ